MPQWNGYTVLSSPMRINIDKLNMVTVLTGMTGVIICRFAVLGLQPITRLRKGSPFYVDKMTLDYCSWRLYPVFRNTPISILSYILSHSYSWLLSIRGHFTFCSVATVSTASSLLCIVRCMQIIAYVMVLLWYSPVGTLHLIIIIGMRNCLN